MKCQRRILKISWRQFVRNSEISALTGLPAINDVIRHRRIAVFGHIARLQDRHLPTSGDRPLDAVIMDERRDGPRWLCDDDDDDDDDE